MTRHVLLAATLSLLAGCYHTTIETGRAPSPQQIDVPWAHSFLYGLVPPEVVDAEEECSSGVARVETQLSFLNKLSGVLTLGLYSPMHVTVTCASGEEQQDASLPVVRTEREVAAALRSGEPFLLPLD